jgi:hypothetical protein
MSNFDNCSKKDEEKLETMSPYAAYVLGYTRAKTKAFWKFKPIKNEDGQIYVHCYVCTNCKAIDEHQGAAPYCWNCGATMEGRLN